MTSQEKTIDEMGGASKYMMPAVEDYLATRCLLLNNIFVGLTLAHEAVEKITKAILILENVKIPKSCHDLIKLVTLLYKKDYVKYKILNNNKKFIKLLDQHYAWRYHDGDKKKRSQSRELSRQVLCKIDFLWISLYELYMNFLPEDLRFGTFLQSCLFDESYKKYDWGWDGVLLKDNYALMKKNDVWKKGYKKYLTR